MATVDEKPPYDFVPKAVTVNIWGMDASMRPFTESVRTCQLAKTAVELDSPRKLSPGDIVGLGYKGLKSRFKVTSSFISTANMYRVILENTAPGCMWETEMLTPDITEERKERRRHPRVPAVGQVVIFNIDGTQAAPARLVDISAGGFYTETYAPAPVGSEMNVRLVANGIAVNLLAAVRTAHAAIGMGVEIVRFASAGDVQGFRQLLLSFGFDPAAKPAD